MVDQTEMDEIGGTGESAESPPRKQKARRGGGLKIYLDDDTAARVEAYRKRFCKEHPGIRPERRDIVVNLVHLGLDAVGVGPQPQSLPLSERSSEELLRLAESRGILWEHSDGDEDAMRRYLIDALEALL